MRNVRFSTPQGELDLEVSDALVEHVAKRNSIPRDAVSDMMLVQFFREASNVALEKAAAEYLESDGTNT